MIDNQTSMLNSHTSKTSTNQNNQQSNSINTANQHHSTLIRRNREFAEPKPRSQAKASHSKYAKSTSKTGAAIIDSMDKHSSQKMPNQRGGGHCADSNSPLHSHNEKLLAAALDNNVLDYSPFNFLQGINPRRLLKGRSLLGRSSLVSALNCTFCNCVIVQGQECDNCESNFCSPCIKQW